MLETLSRGDPPDACLVDTYLGKERNRKREDYFLYEPLGDQQGSVARETMHVDACEVFTGPAGYLPANNSFERCLNNDRITQCNIPFFVWSGRSSGRTPVANYHSLRDPLRSTGNINLREERAMDTFRTISTELATLIKEVNDSFISDPIEVELFSAEGGNPPCALGVFRVRKECAYSAHRVRKEFTDSVYFTLPHQHQGMPSTSSWTACSLAPTPGWTMAAGGTGVPSQSHRGPGPTQRQTSPQGPSLSPALQIRFDPPLS